MISNISILLMILSSPLLKEPSARGRLSRLGFPMPTAEQSFFVLGTLIFVRLGTCPEPEGTRSQGLDEMSRSSWRG